jgi:putative transposase
VRRLCQLFGISHSGYYAWRTRPLSQRHQYDRKLKSLIKELHQGFRRSYGAARLHQELKMRGHACSRRRVGRLMRELGIQAKTTGLYAWRPGMHGLYTSSGNQLKQEEKASGPGQHWAGDYTYLKTRSGWLYLAVVLDLYSRKVVGWSFSRQRNVAMTRSALTMALSRERPRPGCLFH